MNIDNEKLELPDCLVYMSKPAYIANPPSIWLKLRYWFIELLIGDMPVMMNWIIKRPQNINGPIIYFGPNDRSDGLFSCNHLMGMDDKSIGIIVPKKKGEK